MAILLLFPSVRVVTGAATLQGFGFLSAAGVGMPAPPPPPPPPPLTIPSPIEFYLSTQAGTAGYQQDAKPVEALGKYMSRTQIVQGRATQAPPLSELPRNFENLLRSVTKEEAEATTTIYRALFLLNSSPTDFARQVRLYISKLGSGGADVAIGLDPLGKAPKNQSAAQARAPADEFTAPSGVTWTRPTTAETGLLIQANLDPQYVRAVWVRLTVPANSPARSMDSIELVVVGDGHSVGVFTSTLRLVWGVQPSDLRIDQALRGVHNPVRYSFAFEVRDHDNLFVSDVTEFIRSASIELNNDRETLRTATFSVTANTAMDPLSDHLAVIQRLLVDGSYWWPIQLGLFHFSLPHQTHFPTHGTWELQAMDMTLHLLSDRASAPWTVAAGENYITGTNAVEDILRGVREDGLHPELALRYNLPVINETLPAPRTYDPGTPRLAICNDLLRAAGYYGLWPDVYGVFTTREQEGLNQVTPAVGYLEGDGFVIAPIDEESEDTRLANQVVVIVDNPDQGPLSSVATNSDPDSPISTVNLNRTITKILTRTGAASQAVLDTIAERELERSASLYKRVTLRTAPDPRRDAHEVYSLDVGAFGRKWWARNWTLELAIGAQMTHTIARVEKVR